MSRKVYDDGVLVEEWDDDARLVTFYTTAGVFIEQRAYTDDEIADIRGSGDVRIVGSDLVGFADSGSEIIRIGQQPLGDRGLTISRENGTPAFVTRQLFDNDPQVVEVWDGYGNAILSEEAIGSGMGRPLLDIQMQPILATAGTVNAGPHGWEVPVSSGTWTTVFRARFARHNQFGTFTVRVAASDLTTAGEVQIIDDDGGTTLARILESGYIATRAAGSTDYTELTLPGLFLPGDPWESVSLSLQVRRTAGAGTLRTAVSESHGGIF